MIPSDRHSQAFASLISEKDDSLFSDLLSKDLSFSTGLLSRSSHRRIKKLLRTRKKPLTNGPWTACIIIDSTLHSRSSTHIENSQKFYHGKKYITGHQWTNIGILINDQYIPLPPIAFYTKEECSRRGIEYKTEHEKVSNFIKNFSFKQFNVDIKPSEILVLFDSGYDSKKIQNTVISRKWDFISALKCDRKISIIPKVWNQISKYFRDGRRPFKSIRLRSCRGKKSILRQHQVKQQVGYLKDVRQRVKLVCSKRSRDKKIKHLACSNINVSAKTVLEGYRIRWRIEIFHREVKGFMGLEDAAVKRFSSLHNHIHLVFVAYNLLNEKFSNDGLKSAQLKLLKEVEIRRRRKDLHTLSLVGGMMKIKSSIKSALRRDELAYAA
jgi:hypothetical protein